MNEIKAEPQETLKRPDVDEPMQEHPRKKLIDLKQAQRILEERDKLSPLYGFKHLDQLREFVVRALAKYLEILLMHLSGASYGEWTKLHASGNIIRLQSCCRPAR